jgi:hypothetical protein
VALSTAEAEYVALCVAVREVVWLCRLLADLFGHEMDSTVIHCDNQSCVKLFENPVFHDRYGAEESSTRAVPFYT